MEQNDARFLRRIIFKLLEGNERKRNDLLYFTTNPHAIEVGPAAKLHFSRKMHFEKINQL
jgi:hypothetical protein